MQRLWLGPESSACPLMNAAEMAAKPLKLHLWAQKVSGSAEVQWAHVERANGLLSHDYRAAITFIDSDWSHSSDLYVIKWWMRITAGNGFHYFHFSKGAYLCKLLCRSYQRTICADDGNFVRYLSCWGAFIGDGQSFFRGVIHLM